MRLKSYTTVIALLLVAILAQPEGARCNTLWFSPPDNIAQQSPDFRGFLVQEKWEHASKKINVFLITVRYLVNAPPADVSRLVALIKSKRIQLAISIPALPVDKHICGDGVEGMVWPGEPALYAKRLKERGVEPDFFSFDLPLTSSVYSDKKDACGFSIAEAASRLAVSAHTLRDFFPRVKFVDAEVPTGKQAATWISDLNAWLTAYESYTGEKFWGISLDVWWASPWQNLVKETIPVLHSKGIAAGIYLNADKSPGMTPPQWMRDLQTNACAVSATAPSMDYVVVANWMAPFVRNLPESDPNALVSVANWYGTNTSCK